MGRIFSPVDNLEIFTITSFKAVSYTITHGMLKLDLHFAEDNRQRPPYAQPPQNSQVNAVSKQNQNTHMRAV
jgi:hypothetical protein